MKKKMVLVLTKRQHRGTEEANMLAGPLVLVSLLQFCLQLISIMFVGHLGELPLAGASMATSFAAVTGFSLLRAMFVLFLVSIPFAVIWTNTALILKALGQDPDISEEAGVYACFMIPSVFRYAMLQCQVRFLQTQSNVFPMMISSGITTLLHLSLCWTLVLKCGFGSSGAAVSTFISYWLNVVLLSFYIKLSPSCARTWTGFSKEALHNVLSFVRLAVPSAVMVCLEAWSFELIVLLSGLLPNPQLQTFALSICLNTASTVWMIPFGLSGAVSTRVSNELVAGNPIAARLAVGVVLFMAITEGIIVGLVLLLIRNIWGYAYSNEIQVVGYVATIMPILAISNFMDALQCVLSGTVRGCGWQKIGAFMNLGSYYLVGIPLAILFAFAFHIGGKLRSLFGNPMLFAFVFHIGGKGIFSIWGTTVPMNLIASVTACLASHCALMGT